MESPKFSVKPVAHELQAVPRRAERVSLERKESAKVNTGRMQGDSGLVKRRWRALVAGVALGISVVGAMAPLVTLAQTDDVVVVGAADDAFINNLIEEIFAEVFGGGAVVDDATVSGGGDINVGGNMGGSVTMGGGSSGGISIGGGESGS